MDMEIRLALLLVTLTIAAAPAFAQCNTPSGAESQTRYSGNKLYYCGNGAWHEVPGGSASSGAGCVVGSVYVPGGYTHTFFSAATHANCASISQARTCTDGVLSGSVTYSHPFCTAPPPPPTCAGKVVGTYCWYLGAPNQSCTTVCSTHGGYNEATRTYAGDTGTLNNCRDVLDALGATTWNMQDWTDIIQGLGCHVNSNVNPRRITNKATSEGAAQMYDSRACACNG
jgi:hypothetical protein|nr:hypothetical protein [Nitrosomonas nitrosa]